MRQSFATHGRGDRSRPGAVVVAAGAGAPRAVQGSSASFPSWMWWVRPPIARSSAPARSALPAPCRFRPTRCGAEANRGSRFVSQRGSASPLASSRRRPPSRERRPRRSPSPRSLHAAPSRCRQRTIVRFGFVRQHPTPHRGSAPAERRLHLVRITHLTGVDQRCRPARSSAETAIGSKEAQHFLLDSAAHHGRARSKRRRKRPGSWGTTAILGRAFFVDRKHMVSDARCWE